MDYEFHNPMPLARIVRVALACWLVATAIYGGAAGFTLVSIHAFQAGQAGQETLNRIDEINLVVGIGFLVVNLATLVVVGRWIWRVNKNAHVLSDDMTISPGWNIGWFFIPFANWWKPFEGVLQTWQASHSPSDRTLAVVPVWLYIWWGGWVISNILDNIIFQLSRRADTLEAFATIAWIEMFTTPVQLMTGAILLWLVGRLSAIQRDSFEAAEVFE